MDSPNNKYRHHRYWFTALVCLLLLLAGFTAWNVFYEKQVQVEILEELDENSGRYDAQSIVLQNTSPVRAEALAEQLGAKLRITSDGSYATLTLPEGITIRDVCANQENRELLSEFSIDYQASISDLYGSTDEAPGQSSLAAAPRYTVTDDGYSLQTYLDYMNLDTVWSTTKGSSVTVAIIDTGIDTDHPEFRNCISPYSYNATEDKILKDHTGVGGGYDYSLIEDPQGHGTAVAGVVAAGMNGSGTVGIAPSANLLVIKAECDAVGNFARTSDLVFGLYYAIEQGADVVNMSFEVSSIFDPFQDAAQLAYDSNIVCVAAAGNNSSTELTYPAANALVIGVGALADNSWELADYSNYGDNTDLVAPGTVYTTLPGGTYGYDTGTSFAAPAVSGTIALYLDQNQYAASYDVLETLMASCRDLGSPGCDWLYGYGAVDVSALVLEEKGTVTFQMQSDELDDTTQVFVRNHTLQNIPEPERLYAVFDGWYYDPQCTEELEWYADEFSSDLTLYAKWANEDDSVPFTYVTLDDGTVEIRSYTGHRRYITIPDHIDGKPVTAIGDNAFLGEDRLRMVYLPETLVSIGRSAFEGCTNLMDITIPDTVEAIGERAFYADARLSAVSLGSSSDLTVIGDYAFAHCSSLTRFEIPASLESMNGTALYSTVKMALITVRGGNEFFAARDGVLFSKSGTSLISFPAGVTGSYTIPSSVRTVGICAFGYSSLAAIDMNQIETIGPDAFSYSSLESILIPDTVISLDDGAFRNSYSLRTVTLGDGLRRISGQAFDSCTALTSIEIPAKIGTIEEGAFACCTNLSELTFAAGSSLTNINRRAFTSTAIRQLTLPAALMYIGEEAFSGLPHLTAAAFEVGSALRGIDRSAFSGAISLTSIDLPQGLVYIMDYAFQETGLTSVTIPAATENLGSGAFASCHSLKAITVEEGNRSYTGSNGIVYTLDQTELVAYPAGASATTFTVPDTVTTIAPAAFYGSHKLIHVTLTDNVAAIGELAFYDCRKITGYTLTDSLITIGEYAFSRNSALTAFSVPGSVEQIGRFAFAEDYNLASITIDDDTALTRLGYGIFAHTGIRSVRIPAAISTMSQGVFEGCSSLTSVTFAENSRLNTIPAYLFDGSENLETITFEKGSALTAIGANGFANLQNLTMVNWGDAKITQIGNYAFKSCNMLQNITLPDSLEEIGRFAFYGCEGLTELTAPSQVEHIGSYAFYGAENLNLYFKADFLPLYLDENWDSGIAGYHVGVQSIAASGDWRYAVLNSGNLSIVEYLGTSAVIDMNALDLGGTITGISGRAFEKSTVTAITLPDSLINIQSYAFHKSSLESIHIPANVTFIGRNAFSDTPLTSLSFAADSQLRVMEQEAFANTARLTAVTLPQSLTVLGQRAFFRSGLKELRFADGIRLEAIPMQAFGGTALQSVVIPDSITRIGSGAFRDCLQLQSMTLGAGEELYVADHAFYNTDLSDVSIPGNVSYIGEYAFVGLESLDAFHVSADNPYYTAADGLLMSADCRKLIAVPAGRTGSLTVPSSVEELGYGAFENSRLSSVEFAWDANILTLGYRAFYNTKNLTQIELPAGVISIDYYAFAECTALESVTFAEDTLLTGIYEGAFYNCSSLREINLPDTVYEISDFAFYGCESLEHLPVSQDSQLMGIYDYAFSYTGITDLTFPAGLIDIGPYSFMGIRAAEIAVPDDNREQLTIGIGAFAQCNQLEQITVPFIGSAETSKRNWFAYIFGAGSYVSGSQYLPLSLKHVTISEGITKIPDFAFTDLSGLESIDIPHSVVLVGDWAFSGANASHEFTNTIYFEDMATSIGKGISGHLSLSEKHTIIKGYAFSSCSKLEGITLPASITYLDYSAFSNCTSLKEITIPASVTVIRQGCFRYCTALRKVTFKGDLPSIESQVFSTCTSLEQIEWPGQLASIGEHAFYDCESLKHIEIPDSVTTIGAFAFSGCTSLQQLELPDQLVSIGEYAFRNCSALMDLVIPDSVTTIGNCAFLDCYRMQSVTLGSGVTSIGDSAFYATSRLYKITNRSALTLTPGSSDHGYIAENAKLILDAEGNTIWAAEDSDYSEYEYIQTPDGFHFFLEDGVYTLFAYTGTADPVTLPDQINGSDYIIKSMRGVKNVIIPDSMTQISDYAFSGCDSLESVRLPSGLQSIGSDAFASTGIKHIDLPENLKRIESNAFLNCSLEQIRIPGGTEISNNSFAHCYSLNSVILEDGITKLPWNIFTYCSSLETVLLPTTLTSIDPTAFQGCQQLRNISFTGNNPNFTIENGIVYDKAQTKIVLALPDCAGQIVLPNTLTRIEANAFQNCAQITSITIPDGITSIGSYAFIGCSGLETITLPDSLISIGFSSFDGCSSLEAITLPDSLISIGYRAFGDCSSLETITLPDSVTEMDTDVFSGCSSLRSITLPSGLTKISASMFYGCAALEEINIPAGVTEIERDAFNACRSLTSLALPDGVSYIGANAFMDCDRLMDINIPSGLTEILDKTFYGCTSLRSVTIPDSVTAIGNRVFEGCTALLSLSIPDTVTSIGENLLYTSSSIQSISIGNGITTIPTDAFLGCTHLYEVTIGENVTQIEDSAFSGCNNLFMIRNNSDLELTFGSSDHGGLAKSAKLIIDQDGNETLCDGVSSVSFLTEENGFRYLCVDGAYYMIGYEGSDTDVALPLDVNGDPYNIISIGDIEHLTIPTGIRSIHENAFLGNTRLKSVYIGKDIALGRQCFASCSNLEELTIEGGGTSIGERAFAYCSNLHTIHLGDGLSEIAKGAFYRTALENIPDNWCENFLAVNGYLLSVMPDSRYVELDGLQGIAGDAYSGCSLLEIALAGSNNPGLLSRASTLRTLILDQTPNGSLKSTFSSNVPETLRSVVLRKGVEVDRQNMFQGFVGINIFVEADREAAAIWDLQYPGWNNGNKVCYNGEWIISTFYNIDGSILSRSYQSTSEIVRRPYYAIDPDDAYDYTIVGWDLDGDGSADRLPATSAVDIHAHPVVEKTLREYTLTYYDKDGSTVLYTQSVPYGQTVTLPDDPEKTGYTFTGWIGYTDGMTITGNTSFYATWAHLGNGHKYGAAVWFDATCTEQGHNRYTCTICGEWYAADTTLPLGHRYQHTTVAPTCERQGYDEYACSVCGDTYRENFTAHADHKMGSWITDGAPSCSAEGSRHRSCTMCGMTETEIIAQSGHSCESTVTTAPTCESEGVRTCTCQVCGYSFQETIPAAEHRYEKQTVSAMVLEQLLEFMPNMLCGYEADTGYYYLCASCGKIQTSETLGSIQGAISGNDCTHTDNDWITATEQTCSTPHIQWQLCRLCGMAIKARLIAPADPALHDFVTEVTDPSCTEQGYTTHTCTVCGDSHVDTYVDALGHDMGEWFTAIEATCTEDGQEQCECFRCDHYETRIIKSVGHSYEAFVAAPTCTEEGYTQYICSVCDDSYICDYAAPTGHDHEAVITEPTCTEEGYTTYTCHCGDSYVIDHTAALGHIMSDWETVVEATCTENGQERQICYRCDHAETRDIEALGHDWDEGIVSVEPTDETEGEMTYTCKRCGETRYEVIPELEHEHRYEAVVTDPTCTEQGFTTHACRCGDSYESDYTAALGHSFTIYVSDNNATCSQDGTKTSVCDRCDAADTVIDKGSATGHEFTDWTVILDPTETAEGLESRSCIRCGHEEARVIARLENPFTDVPSNSFYYEPVMWAVSNGVTNGTSAITFGPNDQCMRAHVVTFLWRAVGSPEPSRTDNPFVDVKPSDFYYKAVMWALENGITSGMDATHFGPTAYCNRAQVVTFLYRTLGSPEVESTGNPFTDVAEGSFYAKAVLWAVENGITNGLTATAFGPNAICNRAQIVTFLYRAFMD